MSDIPQRRLESIDSREMPEIVNQPASSLPNNIPRRLPQLERPLQASNDDAPIDIQANSDLIQQISTDIDEVMTLLDKNDGLISILSEKATVEEERFSSLTASIETLKNTEQVLNSKIKSLEDENKDLKDNIGANSSGSDELKAQLLKCENKLEQYKNAAVKSRERLNSIRERISRINNSVNSQGSIIQKLSQSMSGGAAKKHTVSKKDFNYIKMVKSLKGTKRANLDKIAKTIGMVPCKYRTKQDLIVAISIIIHAKQGQIKRMSDANIVARNLSIPLVKSKKELCSKINTKLNKVSMQKIQKLM
jgi:chromosome segregation ATPase